MIYGAFGGIESVPTFQIGSLGLVSRFKRQESTKALLGTVPNSIRSWPQPTTNIELSQQTTMAEPEYFITETGRNNHFDHHKT